MALRRAIEVFGKELRKAEGTVLQKLRRGVGDAVPALIGPRIAQAIICREVDHRHASIQKPRCRSERSRMGNGEEHRIACGEHGVVVRGEDEVAGTFYPGKRRVDAAERLPCIGIGRNRPKLEIRVPEQDACKLHARIPCRSDDAHRVRHNSPAIKSCRILHSKIFLMQ